jgi:hypothetical protein
VETLKQFLVKVKHVVLGYRLCHAPGCGQFFRGPGYEILGRTYCCERCSPALYRKVVQMRLEERAQEDADPPHRNDCVCQDCAEERAGGAR